MPANSTLAVRLGFCSTRNGYGCVPSLTAKFPLPRWDFNMFCACVCLCLQGGGVYVGGGTVTFSLCTISGNTAGVVRAHAQNFPSAGILDFALVCLQGGGVYVYRGTVMFTSSSISGNTANAVRAHVQTFLSISPYPHGKIADALASTLTCLHNVRPTLRSSSGYVQQRPETSHRSHCPDGKTADSWESC
jgi:hypothetical protein